MTQPTEPAGPAPLPASAPLATSAPPPVPGPRQVPLLGNLPAFARDPLGFFTRLRGLGDLVEWKLGPQRALFLSRPEHIGELLTGVETRYRHPELGWAFKLVLGDGVVTSEGPAWRRKRALVQPAVRPRRVRAHAGTMTDCAAALAAGWRPGRRVDVRREMLGLTQRIAVQTLFGADTAGRESAIGPAMDVAQREIGSEFRGLTLFLPPWVPTPGRHRLKKAVAVIDREVARVTDHRRRAGDGEARDDLLSRLLAARDEEGEPLGDKEIRDEAVTLYIGGHETTGTTLTWAWYLLSRNPGARALLDRELADVLAGRPPGHDDVKDLPWTERIVKETLRLYPPVWLMTAIAKEGSTLAGRPVAEGTVLWSSQWSAHRDPRWFPDPEAFRPERWDPDASPAVPDHAWFPFGGGARACLGARFAMVEAVLVLATLAQRFHIEVEGGENPPRTGLTLQPSLPVRGTLRAAVPPGAVPRQA
ncbi:cytochrome P450 [Streptomyces liangshanensis]|uniref:Cytochrome P450 n=1 Tax=Streptomyces liangshanensis TaxID=2717324 RepID=A0A6G9GSR9_9ACTN|nr:cytochrome P450 [Streptomyces liangshanensis]QIQ01126.1 cytochrome P450 [Streptomyces liangshanensis]